MLHTLNLYQKPALGTTFIRRFQVYNYRHKISAIGGFDTASCDIHLRDAAEAEQFLDQYIGNRVAVFVDNPANPVWEGFINRMTFAAGNYQYTISLDEMLNQVLVTYTLAAAVIPTNTAAADDTESQAVYGIKAGKIDMGFQYTAGSGVTGLRDVVLSQRAWPKASITQGNGSGLVTLEMLGFWHTLIWEAYNAAQTNTAAITADTILVRILPNVANGNTFFDNTDTTEVDTNTLSLNNNRIRGQTMADVLTELAEVGDGTRPWVVGITPTDPHTSTRRLYYRAFNPAIEYTARQRDGLRIRNPYGQIIPPWMVRPDRGIRITDMLIGWNGLGDDPTETWIAEIEYSANEQSVTWVGSDDTTNEGAFQLNRYNKTHGRAFGATRRFV